MFIIKGVINNQEVYYSSTKKNAFCGVDIQEFEKNFSNAKVFKNICDAEKVAYSLPMMDELKIYPLCPFCGMPYADHPAISRKDNKTKICSECGIIEALIDFYKEKKATL